MKGGELEKAKILVEALPYIQKFYGKTFVIKYGGSAMVDKSLKESFALDVILLNYIGIHPIIVHGGGPQISEIMLRMGKQPEFIYGQRITDKETMDIVEMVLGGKVNKEIVSLINHHGGKAVGLTGKDGGLIKAQKKIITQPMSPKKIERFLGVPPFEETGEPEIIDIGLIGEVVEINTDILSALEEKRFIPVIAPVGVGGDGVTYNINADLVAGSVAAALRAEKLVLLTDVSGIMDKDQRLISTLERKSVENFSAEGIISGGMLPKVQACLTAIDGGVSKTHIIDGRIPHALLLEIFTTEGIGTEITQ
ncbi:MAG: acetylglutamate kinase [Nitrospirota bacterium]